MNKDVSPLISVIIPIYNAEVTLQKTLNSVLNQTYKFFEVLMIDDASADNSKKIATEYTKDPRFKLIFLNKNNGVANARNIGIEASSGEYLCFLDADDWWESEKLSLQIHQMLKENLSLSYMSYYRIDENSSALLSNVNPPKKLTYRQLLSSNHIGNLTTMVKKTCIGDTRFIKKGHEDYIFWLEILKKGITAQLIKTESNQCNYLVRKKSLSANKLKTIKWQWYIYYHYLKLGFVNSFFYLILYIFNGIRKRL